MTILRKRKSNQEIFLEHIVALTTNLLVTNVNYSNGYYNAMGTYEIIKDTKERAKYILEQIENTKHLIDL